jgi:hypothetical protein
MRIDKLPRIRLRWNDGSEATSNTCENPPLKRINKSAINVGRLKWSRAELEQE